MTISKFLIIYAISVTVFFIFDIIWLGVIAGSFYRKTLGHLLSPTVNWTPAVVFYLLFLIGLVVFVILPGINKQSLGYTVAAGALFGLITYATYDLTNLATLRDWPVLVTLIDLVWGTFISAATAGISYLIVNRILS
jgi:uncharacterized membrane protein